MARNFTSEELKQICESQKFQEYLQKAGEDETNLALTHYLKNAKNLSYWEEKFASDVKQHSDEMVIDLSSLDKYKEIDEVIRALRDEDFTSELNQALARVYELKKAGKISKEEFKTEINKLQQNASTQNLHSVQLAMDDKGYMYGYTNANKTHLEEREVPKLSALVLHMRNNSMTAEILQERLNDIRDNHSDDKRAIELYETVINAYRTGNGIDKLDNLVKDENDIRIAEDMAREVEYDNAYDVPTTKKQIEVPGPVPHDDDDNHHDDDPKLKPVILDGVIMRGYNADEWQQLIDGKDTDFLNAIDFVEGVEITALKAIGKLPDNFSDMTPDERRAVIEALSPVEMAKFNGAMNNASQKILETYPPRFMVFLHQRIGEEIKAEEANGKDSNTIDMLKNQLNQLNEAMVNKLEGYVKGDIVIDQTNIADVYDGATEMFAYLKEQNKNSAVITNYADEAQKKLDAEIKIYDETNGFDKVSANDGLAIEKAFEKASKMADELKLEDYPDIQQMIDGLEFESDEQKQTFVDIIKEQAARATSVKGFKDKDEELKKRFDEAIQEAVTVNVGALISTNELLKFDGKVDPKDINQATLEANVAQAIADLKQGKKVTISKNAAIAHAASSVNGVAGYLNRLATRKNDKGETTGIGTKAPVLKKMYDKIQHIDKTCIKRFGPAYETARSYGRAIGNNMMHQGINQLVRYGCNAAGMLLNQPGLGSIAYATYYVAQAGLRLRSQYKQEKQANGGKVNGWNFFTRHLPEIAQTALITAGTVVGGVWGGKAMEVLGHALPIDRMCCYAGMAVGGVTSLIKGYRASRKEGNSVWKSLGKSFGNTALSTGTALACGYGIGAGINAMDTGLHSAGVFGEEMSRDITVNEYNEHASDNVHYHKDVMSADAGKDIYGQKLTAEQLNEKGLIIESAQAGEEGAFETKAAVPGYDEVVYSPGVEDATAEVLGQWYAGHEDMLNERVDALMEQGHMSKLEAMRCLMQIHDAGAHVPTEQTLYSEDANHQNPTTVKSHNMKVFGEGWSNATGISQESVNNLAGMIDENGNIKVTQEGLSAFRDTDKIVGMHNTVGHVDGSPHFHSGDKAPEGWNAGNNSKVVDGVVHEGYGQQGNTQWTTYAKSDAVVSVIHHEPEPAEYHKVSEVGMDHRMPMTTTFDRYWGRIKSFCLLGRAGANGKTKEKENDNRPIRDVVATQKAINDRSTGATK